MRNIHRREFVASALAFGATAVWAGPAAFAKTSNWSLALPRARQLP